MLVFFSMLVCVLINVEEFIPRVHPELTNKIPIASTYRFSSNTKEGLTRDAERITETIRSCARDEGIKKPC
jgi:hypothetical protein